MITIKIMKTFKELFELASITKKKAISSVICFAEDTENDTDFIKLCIQKLMKLYDEIPIKESKPNAG